MKNYSFFYSFLLSVFFAFNFQIKSIDVKEIHDSVEAAKEIINSEEFSELDLVDKVRIDEYFKYLNEAWKSKNAGNDHLFQLNLDLATEYRDMFKADPNQTANQIVQKIIAAGPKKLNNGKYLLKLEKYYEVINSLIEPKIQGGG